MIEKPETKKWIFPPVLQIEKRHFESIFYAVCMTTDRRIPLLLMADRGSGKSAFLDVFRNLYLKENQNVKERRLNIASLPETLLVSELFGHKKGSFTDARADKRGHLETLGDGGLLMLEEIGDISKEIQAKLLTVIEDGEFFPIGETEKPRRVKNIQIIATTNRPPNFFRDDFFDRFLDYRISPLHERRMDILPYFKHFMGDAMSNLTRFDVMAIMAGHWPDNVRGIEKMVLRFKSVAYDIEHKPVSGPHKPFRANWGNLQAVHGYRELQKKLAKYNLALDHDAGRAFKEKVPDTFELEYVGLRLFCEHTGQDINANYNLLNLTDKTKPQDFDIAELNHNELQKKYLAALLQRTGGNKAEAARKAGMNHQTFRSMLKRYDIS